MMLAPDSTEAPPGRGGSASPNSGVSSAGGFGFHPERHRLLAEAHARPYTALDRPTLTTRIGANAGARNLRADWEHMVALCRRYQAPEPAEGARWCSLDAGNWSLRWERHTELSSWTFYRPIADDHLPANDETALELVPKDWLSELPGNVLVGAHIALLRDKNNAAQWSYGDDIAVNIAGGRLELRTDFRPGSDGFTRFLLVQPEEAASIAGRTVQQIFEVETYRLMAMLGFPVADTAGKELAKLEEMASSAAGEVVRDGDIDSDRELLNRLAALAGEAQALYGRTSYRFAASRAYYGIVLERIQQLREERIDGRPTIAEFMERRHAPAMRTCTAVAERQKAVIDQIARATQLLSTRVEVATEITNAGLLASMDRRATLQLRLQQTVEGLSVAAISYYSIGLLKYIFEGIEKTVPQFDPKIATGIAAPLVIAGVWYLLSRLRKKMLREEQN